MRDSERGREEEGDGGDGGGRKSEREIMTLGVDQTETVFVMFGVPVGISRSATCGPGWGGCFGVEYLVGH